MNLSFLRRITLPFFEFWLIILFLFIAIQFASIPVKEIHSQSFDSFQGFERLLPTPAPYPFFNNIFSLPDLSAKSAIAVDLDSAITLYEKNADDRLLPASTTKMMTALIALENYNIDQVLVYEQKETSGTIIDLKPGEKMTVENLLYGALVGSGNDAASVLADSFPGGRERFINAMNIKAKELNLQNTQFANPIGLDQANHYSSARDLARLAAVVIRNPLFAKIVATPEITITDVSGLIVHKLKNTNELIGTVETARGIKTGKTDSAKECLVALFEKDTHRLVTVVLGSDARITETKILSDWVFGNFQWGIFTPKLSFR